MHATSFIIIMAAGMQPIERASAVYMHAPDTIIKAVLAAVAEHPVGHASRRNDSHVYLYATRLGLSNQQNRAYTAPV
jgi:hypothetical protein